MNIFWTVLIGIVSGLVARIVAPVKKAGGFLEVTAIGVIGSIGAYYVGFASGWYSAQDFLGLISAAIGAVLLLTIHLIASSKPN